MADVPREMAAAGTEFLAEEHHDAARLEAKVEAMGAAAPGAAPAAAAPVSAPTVLPDESTQKLCKGIVQVLDRVIVGFTIPELRLTVDEVEQISVAAVPVLNKHLPEILQKLAGTVEGQFVLVVAMIYASKAPGIFLAPPKPTPPAMPPAKPGETPAAPAAPAPVVTA